MYNIIQLNDKDLSELQSIAKELGIKKTDSLKKEDLVYKILCLVLGCSIDLVTVFFNVDT